MTEVATEIFAYSPTIGLDPFKGQFEIWFRTSAGEIGKIHYTSKGSFNYTEWRDWVKHG